MRWPIGRAGDRLPARQRADCRAMVRLRVRFAWWVEALSSRPSKYVGALRGGTGVFRGESPLFALVGVLLLAGCSGLGAGQSPEPDTDVTAELEPSSTGTVDEDAEESPTTEDARAGQFPALAVGIGTSCMVRSNGDVSCWGQGAFPETDRYPEPVTLAGYSDAVGVGIVADVPCVLSRDSALSCGYLATSNLFAGLDAVSAWAENGLDFCVLHDGGSVSCRGGLSGADPSASWERVDGVIDAVAISAGYYHFCVLREGGLVSCWGDNDDGQLGDGTLRPRSGVVDVVGVTDVRALGAGAHFTCVVDHAGDTICWGGAGGDDALGEDSSSRLEDEQVEFRVIEGLAAAVDVGAGEDFACVLHTNGSVSCLGSNYDGQLGDGTTESRSSPVRVRGLDDALELAVGPSHACVRRPDDQYLCWGSNAYGQLGDGSIENFEERSAPEDPDHDS